jgi:hypothetical protein
MPAPANVDDPRYLAELAFKNILLQLWAPAPPGSAPATVYITGDTTEHTHPCVLVRALEAKEQLAPGTGIFRIRVQLDLKQKLDQENAETSEQELRSVRQCFYRNDLDPRPMIDLALRLTAAVSQPFTCNGVVPVEEIAPAIESDVRVLTRSLAFDVIAVANR